MKDKTKLSQDELRQKVDGFSLERSDERTSKDSYKIIDQPLYFSHSVDYEEIKKSKK